MDSSAGREVLTDESQDEEISALRARVASLEAQVTARDNLLAVAAHELRNPMHTILLLVTAALMIARRDNVQGLTVKLERIRHVVDIYVKRCTLLLDSVRLEAKAWAADRREFDLCDVVREISSSYEPEAQYASATIALHLPASLRGQWDRLAVEQIVANLISNAIKYGQGSRIDVIVEAMGPVARLTVRDQGTGISESDQLRIFERFQQAIGSGQKRSGFGIGLWLIKSLVEAHGGSVSVVSRPLQGATFTVLLPGAFSANEHQATGSENPGSPET